LLPTPPSSSGGASLGGPQQQDWTQHDTRPAAEAMDRAREPSPQEQPEVTLTLRAKEDESSEGQEEYAIKQLWEKNNGLESAETDASLRK